MQSKFEEMGSFFDTRADGYDEHMLGLFKDFDEYYERVASPIAKTDKQVSILDLGCGTGAELRWVFKRVPNARITGIDMSGQMLAKLAQKLSEYEGQLNLIQGSYLTIPFGQAQYSENYSAEAIHEAQDAKGTLYHFDIPSTIDTQIRLLREAGFTKVELIFHDEGEEPAIFVAEG